MGIAYTLAIFGIVGFILYKVLIKKSIPTSNFSPVDEFTTGIKPDTDQKFPLEDTRHHIPYEESIRVEEKDDRQRDL
ncbi:DUF3951 domain-containing protein [Chryseomicrobium sp. FSL W7-1435]|uniref:DUF3951 domain-containing protein n=1 Tax=Chryseomicrobium sp. FSL W7-1435 TaxID=2921704 RepID=UPI00315ADC56